MKKREFIKASILGLGAVSSLSLKANMLPKRFRFDGFNIPKLKYSATDIQDVCSNSVYSSHYKKHYISYFKNLSKEINTLTFRPESVKFILTHQEQFSKKIVSNACGYYNHKLYFKLLTPGSNVKQAKNFSAKLISQLGSLDVLKNQIIEEANNLSTDGWIWVIVNKGNLEVVSTSKNSNPLLSNIKESKKGFPIIGIDLWEHAFMDKFGNNRQEYIASVLKNLDWSFIEKRYIRSLHHSI